MCTASDMRIYNVDIKPKTRYNMPDNKQGWNITLEYLMFRAGVAQWQSVGFPSRSRGFDSHHPLHFFNTARLLITVEIYFAVNKKRNRISININTAMAATVNTSAKYASAACFAALLPLFLFAEDLLKFSFLRTAFSKSKSCGCGMLFT